VAVYDPTLVHPYDHRLRALHLEVKPGSPADRYGVVSLDPRWVVRRSDQS
jgi:hypothetical protein